MMRLGPLRTSPISRKTGERPLSFRRTRERSSDQSCLRICCSSAVPVDGKFVLLSTTVRMGVQINELFSCAPAGAVREIRTAIAAGSIRVDGIVKGGSRKSGGQGGCTELYTFACKRYDRSTIDPYISGGLRARTDQPSAWGTLLMRRRVWALCCTVDVCDPDLHSKDAHVWFFSSTFYRLSEAHRKNCFHSCRRCILRNRQCVFFDDQ